MNNSNGMSLSVTFVLQHHMPVPVAAATMEKMHKIVYGQSEREREGEKEREREGEGGREGRRVRKTETWP